jgi:hypothetical protein
MVSSVPEARACKVGPPLLFLVLEALARAGASSCRWKRLHEHQVWRGRRPREYRKGTTRVKTQATGTLRGEARVAAFLGARRGRLRNRIFPCQHFLAFKARQRFAPRESLSGSSTEGCNDEPGFAACPLRPPPSPAERRLSLNRGPFAVSNQAESESRPNGYCRSVGPLLEEDSRRGTGGPERRERCRSLRGREPPSGPGGARHAPLPFRGKPPSLRSR